jgi:uncharacterized membrane protein
VSELPIQRRFERRAVRLQARLEAGAGDRWLPWLTTVALSSFLIWTALAKVRSLKTGVDLAGYAQAVWLISDGKMPQASLFGTEVHMLELHWSFVLYPLALLALVAPPAELLMVAQALALGIAVLPLWWLARQVGHLRVGAASVLTLAYALHPATHRLGTEDFHPDVLAVPALIGMAYFGATKRWVPYWLCIAFALACRADLGLAVALWGFVVLGTRERSVGVWTLGIGLGWSLGLLLVVQPIIGDASIVSDQFGYDDTGLGEVVLSSLRDPVDTMRDLLGRENITLVVGLLSPLIFLPLLSLRYLAPAFPLAVIYLIADVPVEREFAGRAAMLLAFMMIAATFALNRLGNMGVDRVFLDVRVLTTLAAASVLSFVAASPISPYEVPWRLDELDATDAAAAEAIDMIDPEVAVRASPSTLAAMSERPWLFTLDPERLPSAAQAGFPDFTRAVLVVEREIPPRTVDERDEFDRSMLSQGFVLILDDRERGVTLYSRDESSVTAGP